VRPDFGPGPYEAVEEFLAAFPGRLEPDPAREAKFGMTFAPCGYFTKT
jgi:cephalosporin hydroxylase